MRELLQILIFASLPERDKKRTEVDTIWYQHLSLKNEVAKRQGTKYQSAFSMQSGI